MESQTGNKGNTTPNTPNNAEETPNKDSNLVERHGIEGSPFQLVKTKEGWFIAMGIHRITDPTKTEEETMDKFITDHWNITITVIAIVCRLVQQQMQMEQETKEHISYEIQNGIK